MALTSMSSDVYAAVVTHAQDPQGQGRVRLRIPQVTGNVVTGWASPTGQVTRQAVVGERVWVSFEGGGTRLVYWTAEPGLISGAQLAVGALDGITVSATTPLRSSDSWTDPSLTAGWATTTSFAAQGAVNPLQFRRDIEGSLHLCGALKITDPAASAVAFTLPAGYFSAKWEIGYPVVEAKADGTFITSWGYVNTSGAVHFDKPASFTRNAGDSFYVNARVPLSIT
ncbi:phage baseplate assembly protein V [Streptomyces sp. VTCC 41912]|uniref:phage baseplate assembly protein V n=1 Tax=Streptomyces sp. VTCC 41912 TaxID=3383243 RepID=UPI00389686F6